MPKEPKFSVEPIQVRSVFITPNKKSQTVSVRGAVANTVVVLAKGQSFSAISRGSEGLVINDVIISTPLGGAEAFQELVDAILDALADL